MNNSPKDYKEFCKLLNELKFSNEFMITNIKTIDFIESMHAWLEDTCGGEEFFNNSLDESITWGDLLILIKASSIYE